MEIYLFKTSDSVLFRKLLEEAVATKRHGSINWNIPPDSVETNRVKDQYAGCFQTKGDTTSLLINTNCYDVISTLADSLSSPLLCVLFQEKSFWETSLFVGQDQKVRFSTCPAEWGEDEAKKYFCNPAVLANIWGVPVEKFDRYLIDWGLTTVWVEKLQIMSPTYKKRGEKAYLSDTYEYGDLDQGFDFINALGAANPQEGERFTVHLPPIHLARRS